MRSFHLKIKHVKNAYVMDDDYDDSKTFAICERPFKCTCLCCGRPVMKVFLKNPDYYVGSVKDPFSCCDLTFQTLNANNEKKFEMNANCCQCGICCRNGCGACAEVQIPIYNASNNKKIPENKDGLVRKAERDCAKSILTDADNFEITFPENATPEEKLLLICTTLMIDYRYYEVTAGNNRSHYY
jgi:hypothetical protein